MREISLTPHHDLFVHGSHDEATAAIAMLAALHHDAPPNASVVSFGDDATGEVDVTYAPSIVVASDPIERRAIVERIAAAGGTFSSGRFGSREIADSTLVGDGSLLGPLCYVGAQTIIGSHVLVSALVSIGHDCTIEDFVTIGAGAVVSGYVVIETGATIGMGATIVNGTMERPIRVGANASIAPGAVVMKHVRAGKTVIGNPARETVEPAL